MPSPRAAPSSTLATPPAMFAPARLCTRRVPERSRIAATIAAVVVLPFVAEITALPCGRRPARRAIASGSRRMQDLAGQARRAAPAAPRERAGGARDGDLRAEHHGAGDQDAQGVRHDADRDRRVADRVAVGVDGERPVGVDVQLAPAQDAHGGVVHVGAAEDLRQVAQEAALGVLAR